jgi:hypothetical protein
MIQPGAKVLNHKILLTYYLELEISSGRGKWELVSYHTSLNNFRRKTTKSNTLALPFCQEVSVKQAKSSKTHPPLPIVWTRLSEGQCYIDCTFDSFRRSSANAIFIMFALLVSRPTL